MLHPSADRETLDNAMPSRTLGLVVLRGPNVALISPTDGSAGTSLIPSWSSLDIIEMILMPRLEIENPFN